MKRENIEIALTRFYNCLRSDLVELDDSIKILLEDENNFVHLFNHARKIKFESELDRAQAVSKWAKAVNLLKELEEEITRRMREEKTTKLAGLEIIESEGYAKPMADIPSRTISHHITMAVAEKYPDIMRFANKVELYELDLVLAREAVAKGETVSFLDKITRKLLVNA